MNALGQEVGTLLNTRQAVELQQDIIMSPVLGPLQAVSSENTYNILALAEKAVPEENGLWSLLGSGWHEINQQEGEQEKGDDRTCDIHSFGFQCSRKGFTVRESFVLKRLIQKNIFTAATLNEIPVTQSFAYGIYCIRKVKIWLNAISNLLKLMNEWVFPLGILQST